MINHKIFLVIASVAMMSLTGCDDQNDKSENNNENTPVASESVKTSEQYKLAEGELIHWDVSYAGEEVIIKAILAPGWKTYSNSGQNGLGASPTSITFIPSEHFTITEKLQEFDIKTGIDPKTNQEISYFENKVLFKQKINVKSGEDFVLKGNVNFMICNANECLPPQDHAFEITINPS